MQYLERILNFPNIEKTKFGTNQTQVLHLEPTFEPPILQKKSKPWTKPKVLTASKNWVNFPFSIGTILIIPNF